jgi:hypothetical protein
MIADKYLTQIQTIKREILVNVKLYVEEIHKRDIVLRVPFISLKGFSIVEVSSYGVLVSDNRGYRWLEQIDSLPIEELLKILNLIEKGEINDPK